MLASIAAITVAQTSATSFSETVYAHIEEIRSDPEINSGEKAELFDSLYHVCVNTNDLCNQIAARTAQGMALDHLGMPDSALALLLWADSKYEESCDPRIQVAVYAQLTGVYLSLGDDERIDSIARLAYGIWDPGWEDQDYRFAIMHNQAIGKVYGGDINAANALFWEALRESRAVGNTKYHRRSLSNLATLKGFTEDPDSARYFLEEATKVAREEDDPEELLAFLLNLANLETDAGNFAKAEVYLDSVRAIAGQHMRPEWLIAACLSNADLLAERGQYRAAYDSLMRYTELHKEFVNEERVKAVAEMTEKYQSERRVRQIQELELEKLDAQIEKERITHGRNRLLFAGGLVLLLAIGLFGRLRYVRRSREEIQHERDTADNLLLNILPASVASELKASGTTQARSFETATIMFSDFKEFTRSAGGMSASDVVDSVNLYFKAFDGIVTQYGVEKIKTIGDAYMAAGGIESSKPVTVSDVVQCAIAMQKFVLARQEEENVDGRTVFEMRVGIHTGPVVAGIVGDKKFQYDLWGDAVNIASRMEANGVPGKVNISSATYVLIKDNPRFVFESRGMIDVKGKGAMEMYFVWEANEQ